MAKKTYRTHHLKGLQILLFDESGHTTEVNFRGGVQIDSTAKFTTSNEEVQNALENCSSFNRDFYLESVSEDSPAVAPTKPAPAAKEEVVEEPVAEESEDNGNVVKVSDRSDAIEWLKEHYPEKNYTSTKLRGKAFDEACKDCGVEFVFA